MKTTEVRFDEKVYDLNDMAQARELQFRIAPANWPAEPKEAVRLFYALEAMAAHQFKRHFAHNIKKIMGIAIDQQAESGAAEVDVTFKVSVDMRALQVAALSDIKMSYSRKYQSVGKPQTRDLAQGDFIDEMDLEEGEVSLAQEMAPPPDEPETTDTDDNQNGPPTGEPGDDSAQNQSPPPTEGDSEQSDAEQGDPKAKKARKKRTAKK